MNEVLQDNQVAPYSSRHVYRKGLNVDKLDFNPSGSCEPGGLYFASKDILCFLDYGCWLATIEIPEGDCIYEDSKMYSDSPQKWKAHRIIIKSFELITPKVVQRLIDEGADVTTRQYPLQAAISTKKIWLIKLLLKNGARPSMNTLLCSYDYGPHVRKLMGACLEKDSTGR